MKIGIDIRNIGKKRTGDEVVFLNLVKNLAEIDGENNYLLFTDIQDKKTLEKIEKDLKIAEKDNFKITSLKTANKFTWNFWTLSRYLRKNPVDIYLTQYITPFFVPRSVKIITIIHDISFNFYPKMIRKIDLFFLKTLIPGSLKRADKIIGVSKFTQDEIVRYYKIDPEKVVWFHNAVSDDFLKQDVSEKKIKFVKEKYKLPENYIFYIGTHEPRKNLPVLVESFARLKSYYKSEGNEAHGSIKLVLAGGKGRHYDRKIEKSIEKHDLTQEVFLPGFIDEEDKAALMKGARIFCFPSLYEGFGIPILEAMSVGTPVIVSNIPAHKEIAEYAALYFEPGSPQELSDRINLLMSDSNLWQNLVKKGLERVGIFSWKKSAKRMLEIFKNI